VTGPDSPRRSHLRLVRDASLAELPDEELMELHRDDRPGAFDVLVLRYRGPIFGYLRRMGLTPSRAEEVAADVFLKVHRAAPRYERTAKFTTYLYTVARRAGLNAQQRLSHRLEVAADEATLDRASASPNPERDLAAKRSFEALQGELDELPEGHRSTFVLYYGQGLSCAEVAAALDISTAEAKGRLAYARKLLRQRLAGRVPEASPPPETT
jgi:RNA polymerase sigma-70 factor, ECF subfamily